MSDFNQIWILSTDFHKVHNIKFDRNPLSGGSVVNTDGQTDEGKKCFCDYANSPKLHT